MAKENPLDDFPDASPLSGEETDIDQQVDGLRGVLKKDAGELPIVDDDSAGGANMADFGSDFGSDFAAEPEAGGLNDPFGLEDTGAEADFPAPGSDFGGDFGAGAGDFGGSADALGGDFGAAAASKHEPKLGPTGEATRADVVLDIPVDVQIILGTSRMSVSSLMDLSEGATIALDRKIGEPVEITVNGKLIGRGEITVLESDETRFGVRMIEVYGAPAKKD